MRQYFIEGQLHIDERFSFNSENSHHIKDVLRMKSDDEVRVVDSDGQVFLARLEISDKEVVGTVQQQIDPNCQQKEIIYCAALIKKDKWELLLQKATELGATTIVPLITSRTIIQLKDSEIDKKLERWNKIVLEAVNQCNRTDLCRVVRPVKLKQIEEYKSETNFVAYEKEEGNYLFDLLEKDKSVTFVTGPEGGLSREEAEFLTEKGFVSCSLGQRILRAETAGMYFLALIDAKRNSI